MDNQLFSLTIHKSRLNHNSGKKLSLKSKITFEEFLQISSDTLQFKAKRVFNGMGDEIFDIGELQIIKEVIITEGEDYQHGQNSGTIPSSSVKESFNSQAGVNSCSIAIMGSAAVGKSSITMRYIYQNFPEQYDPTLQDKFVKNDLIEGKLYQLDILDTAGQEDYSPMRNLWMKGREGFLFVYAVDDKKSFEEISILHQQLSAIFNDKEVPIALVANKIDLSTNRIISKAEGIELSQKIKAEYFECSAKNGQNIETIFQQLARKAVEQKLLQQGKDYKNFQRQTDQDEQPHFCPKCLIF